MGELTIRCPKTGKAVATGIYIERGDSARCRSSSIARFVHRAALRTSGLRGTHGSAIVAPWTVTRIVIGKPLSAGGRRATGTGWTPIIKSK